MSSLESYVELRAAAVDGAVLILEDDQFEINLDTVGR